MMAAGVGLALVSAIGSAVANSSKAERDLRHVTWMQAAGMLGLAIKEVTPHVELKGMIRGRGVRVIVNPAPALEIAISIDGRGTIPRGVTMEPRRTSLFRGSREVRTGDPEFDARMRVDGVAEDVMVLLNAKARRAILRELLDGITIQD